MLRGRRIVLIEDDEIMGAALAQRLELEGAQVVWRRQALRGLHAVRTPAAPVDAVVCDILLRDGTGEELFAKLSREAAPPPFLFITAQAGVDQAVRLLRAGAADYLAKPFEMDVFLERLARLMAPRPAVETEPLLGVSPAAQAVEAMAAKAAVEDRPVLLRGPSGVGKGLLARRIHALSDRRAAPYAEVDARRGADPEAALFGPDGALAQVGEGVLHLAALGRLPRPAQDRLVAALAADPPFRVVASCGLGIDRRIAAGGFRADLFYCFAAREIAVPPLAQRPEDALWLLRQLFPHFNARREAPLSGFSELAEQAALGHEWPGNGRELRARLARAVEMAAGPWLFPADLFPEMQAQEAFRTLGEARDAAERSQILAALGRTGGQTTEAARLLGVSRTTLWEKMQKLGL
ncbi:MAG: sigma-54-dependent transcriptional regulator [Rubrimonas sp.]|uniref:sigma-54-dependent transcriptional regulator n=1 Tax=Rubrimonas sp. TaxID=2036015 RepID=UPI002FDE816A